MPYSLEHKKWFYNETKYLIAYLELAKKYNIKVTAFISWLEIERNFKVYKNILEKYWDMIEIWGHTWDSYVSYFKWEWFIYKKLFWCTMWPYFKQYKDIKKTTEIIKKLWTKPISWRTHAYSSNKITRKILKQFWYKIISDLSWENTLSNDLMELPPNTLPDHENIKHIWINVHKNSILSTEEYKKQLFKQLLENDYSILLLHATCQKYIDNFKTLEEIFKFIKENNFKSLLLKDYV